ncbi:helix-turn-helix domain-containing protein [Flavobacterium granuli]|uniref:Helix-turn-helix n=1 Tax=Flavobacterium granuli TaxID=280093 RepID=A0A1M5P2L9_9FLAO|nr:helix-turn-helix transcriptional regulator [Flavobacterium granuli]PRZ23473.1 helix-turn-helix protein [Flavobacterium granuli]SHG95639.1 Helix-turn-helix [Flavobacterium granuli]
MVNIEDFIKRLEIILDYYGLNASAFADKIGVQRSSLSHLLSGRNKPSLDFILKILDVFPDVDLYWILNGKGVFPKSPGETYNPENKIAEVVNSTIPSPTQSDLIPEDLFTAANPATKPEEEITKTKENPNRPIYPNSGEVEKIVFFYKNGTFKVFNPN